MRARQLTRAGVAAFALLAAGCGGGDAGEDRQRTAEPAPSESPAPPAPAALAQLDGASDTGPYVSALVGLAPLCNEDGGDLADIAVVTRDVLGSEGVEVSLLEVLRGIGGSVPQAAAPTDCDQIAAAWATLMMPGG